MVHTVERVFLGWDQPALPIAAAHLIEHYIDGAVADLRPATLVLPGGRARRRIVELLLDAAQDLGATLIPPRATTVGHLPGMLDGSTKPLADDVTSLRAWSRALRGVDREALKGVFPQLPAQENMAAWDELAGLLAGLHRDLAGEGHRFGDVVRICSSGLLFDDGTRWTLLEQVQRRYLYVLDQAGLTDRYEARMAALESGVRPFAGDLWLISIVHLPAVTRRLLEASGAQTRSFVHAPERLGTADRATPGRDPNSAFDEFGLPLTEYWESANVPVTDSLLTMVDQPVNQADAVVQALVALDGKYSAQEVILGVHPEAEVVPYLEQRLEARGASARYAGGTRVSRTGPFRLLQAVADYLDEGSFTALAALLRHPDAGPLSGAGRVAAEKSPDPTAFRPQALEAADSYFSRHLPFKAQGELPVDARIPSSALPGLAREIERDGPLSRFGGRRPLSQWMSLVMDVLMSCYGDLEWKRSLPAHRRLFAVLERLQAVAAALNGLPKDVDEECTGGGAIRALLLELREESLPPDAGRDAVELLDWLELPLDDAPAVVLTGFNEGFLPESVNGHPFLPDALRTRLGLIDNRRRLARDAYRLTTVLHSKESIRLISGRRSSKGDPLRPSRLMFRIPDDQMPARVLEFLRKDAIDRSGSGLAELGLQPSGKSEFTVPPEQTIKLDFAEVPVRLAVTQFKAVLSDPYRFVLERTFNLNALDDSARELDPMQFGSLAHDVLKRFGLLALDSPTGVDAGDAAAVESTLLSLLEDEVLKRFGAAALPAVHLQVEQLVPRLKAFAQRQAAWAAEGWQIAAVECGPDNDTISIEVDGTPFFLNGRIDRIDHNPSTGQWVVLDYKTGNSVESPARTHLRGKDADRRWIDLQLPLYRLLLPGVMNEQGDPIVDPDAVEQGKLLFGYVSLPQTATDCDFLIVEWNDADLAEAESTAEHVVQRLRKGVFEFDRSVTKVSRWGRDSLKPLITVGWQAKGDDGETASESDDDETEDTQ